MGIQTAKIEPHWNYLVAIESDLERLSRFVEFNSDNFNCYSLEIGRLLLSLFSTASFSSEEIIFNENPALIKVGFRRIGVGKSFIHSDLDNDKPNAIWLY